MDLKGFLYYYLAMGRMILTICMAFTVMGVLSGCDYLAKVDERDITPDVPKEIQILDKKTVKKELKPAELEEILPPDFDPSTDK